MYNSVVEFSQFGIIPTVGGTYEIACDALESVNIVRVAFRTFLQVGRRILIAAVHASVAVVVYRAIAYVVLVHEIDDIGYGLRIVSGVAVYLHVEYMTASGEFVIRGLNLGLVSGRAVVVDRHMIGISVVYLVGDTLDDAESLAVLGCEFA